MSGISRMNMQTKTKQTGTLGIIEAVPETGATGPLTRAISRRRLRRRQWHIFVECVLMIILDAWLISIAFALAYNFRLSLNYQPGFFSQLLAFARQNLLADPSIKQELADISQFQGLEFGIMLGLIMIFAVRGLYSIRLTGTWFRQCWNIISSATMGLGFVFAYFFVFQPAGSSRLLVLFTWGAAIVILCTSRLIVSGAMGLLYRMGLGETRVLVVPSRTISLGLSSLTTERPNTFW